MIQTGRFLLEIVAMVQLVASVNDAASGNVPEPLRTVSTALRAFLLDPPYVHPDCLPGGTRDFATESAILGAGIALTLLDLLFGHVRWLRIEQLVCGWKCFGASKSAAARFARQRVTVWIRYAAASLLCVVYVKVSKTALDMICCRASFALDGRVGLISDQAVPCFTAEHVPVFVLGVAAFALVTLVWPFANLMLLCRKLALHQPPATTAAAKASADERAGAEAKRRSCMECCCDVVVDAPKDPPPAVERGGAALERWKSVVRKKKWRTLSGGEGALSTTFVFAHSFVCSSILLFALFFLFARAVL